MSSCTGEFIAFIQSAQLGLTNDEVAPLCCLYMRARAMIFQSQVNSAPLSLSSHTCLLNSVAFVFAEFLKEAMCFRYLDLNWSPVSPMYVSSRPSLLTVAWQMRHWVRHSPLRGQDDGVLQLHVLVGFACGCWRTDLLWVDIFLPRFGIHKQLIFSVFLLKIVFSGWSRLKDCLTIFKNFLPTSVATLLLKGGLNQEMLRLRFFGFDRCLFSGGSYWSWWLYLVFPNACWYAGAARSKAYFDDEISFSLWLIARGIFLVMLGGWLLSVWTYKGVLSGFMYGSQVFFSRSRVTSRKFTTFLFASVVIFRPFSLKRCRSVSLLAPFFEPIHGTNPGRRRGIDLLCF